MALLRNYVNEHQDDWDEYVTALTYAYNTSVHRSTGTTPFDLVLSHPPARFTLHYVVGEPLYDPNSKKSREDYIRKLEMAILKARVWLKKTHLGLRKLSLGISKTLTKEFALAIATFLLVNTYTLTLETEKRYMVSLDLLPKAHIGYCLTTSVPLFIQRREVVERVNSDRVTYAPPPENAPPILRFEASTTDILEKNIDGQTYLVDKLLEHRIHDDGNMHFLVKWIDYPEPSWQPRSDIPEELISRYFAKVRVEQEHNGGNRI